MRTWDKMRKRGPIWVLIGVVIYIGGILAERPLLLRGTEIPFGLIVIGMGLLLLLVDFLRARRGLKEDERGDPPTP
jgi:hypothetical protein